MSFQKIFNRTSKSHKASTSTQTEPDSPEIPQIHIETPEMHEGPCTAWCKHESGKTRLPETHPSQPVAPANTDSNASLTDMMVKAKEFGLPVIVVNVNTSSPNTTPAKVDISLPDGHSALFRDQNTTTHLESTPKHNLRSALFHHDTSFGSPGSGVGYLPPDPGCSTLLGNNSGIRSRPQSMAASSPLSMYLPSVSAFSSDGDEHRRWIDDDDEPLPMAPTHVRQLIRTASEAIVKATAASYDAMRANHVPEDRTTYMKTCNAISLRLQTLGTTIDRRDANKEEQHRHLRTDWYSYFLNRLASAERTLENLVIVAQSIIQKCNPAEYTRKPLNMTTFEHINTRLKAYLAKLENLNAKLSSALDRIEASLARPQWEAACEEVRQADHELKEALDRSQSAKAHEAHMRRQMDSSLGSRRSHRRNSLHS